MTKSLKTDIFLLAKASLNIINAKKNFIIKALTLESIVLIVGISNIY